MYTNSVHSIRNAHAYGFLMPVAPWPLEIHFITLNGPKLGSFLRNFGFRAFRAAKGRRALASKLQVPQPMGRRSMTPRRMAPSMGAAFVRDREERFKAALHR